MQTEIILNSALKEKVSSKKGTKYFVIEVEIKPGYTIQFFPEKSDLEIIKMYYGFDTKENN